MAEASVLHVYEVGMGTVVRKVEGPSAGAAAVYFGLNLINTNNPLAAVVYSEDGQPWVGDPYWLDFAPSTEHMKMVAERVRDELKLCHVVE